jgi:hypothetical protein
LKKCRRGHSTPLISKIVFAIPNFPDFLAHGVIRDLPGGGWKREDEIRLAFSNWRVTIRNTTDIRDRKEFLRANGGFGITATGVLESADVQPFIWADSESHLEALRVFLSFVCGRWTGPMLPAGIGPTGERVWCRWSIPVLDDGFAVFTWFDAHRGQTLSDIFPGFMAKWKDPVWRETISYAVYWFVRANPAGAGGDGSLILSQAALEMLSWTYLVKAAGRLSKTQFKNLSAAGRIRDLLSQLKIPTAVPVALEELYIESNSRGWPDGVEAITSIRNDLVHPEKGSQIGPVLEAWVLAQRFVELFSCDSLGSTANMQTEQF